jgi:hypothetical protein
MNETNVQSNLLILTNLRIKLMVGGRVWFAGFELVATLIERVLVEIPAQKRRPEGQEALLSWLL